MQAVISAIDSATAVVGFPAVVTLDAAGGDELRATLAEVGSGYARVIVDLAQVTFVDSTALGDLVGLRRRLHSKGGEIRLANARPAVLRILELTRLDSAFPAYASVAAAHASMPSFNATP